MRGDVSGESPELEHTSAAAGTGKPSRTYLKEITVAGFRGIGPRITLALAPGPGLTLVTGRNGSGKSSIAEAAELALTGENRRWSERAAVWKEGWRNLHQRATATIAVEMTEDGAPGIMTVTREWAADAGLEDAKAHIRGNGGPPRPLAALGWTKPLELYRPFLSYSELGALVRGQPSKMHDALQAILGLDLLIDAERALNDSRKAADSASRRARQELPALLEKLAGHPDQRARAAEKALSGKVPDLDALALEHRSEHAGEPCPVCGGRVLDDAWVSQASASVKRLTSRAKRAEAAHAEKAAALDELRRMIMPKPAVLSEDLGTEADPGPASAAWDNWALPSPTLAMYEGLVVPLAGVQEQAAAALKRRAEAWQPIASDLAAWAKQARESRQAAVRLADLKKAIEWLRKAGNLVRNTRLAPFADTSAEVWEMLRQQSNVELGPITLAGAGPQRKVALDVTVDGVRGAALGVMSQGELHSLGLSLFLPRATATDSPFGFLVIDDPVQSMDPAKVDGLARVLSFVARTRQVVVFTHDDRLPTALRQLQLPATVWAVTRREQSVVALKKTDDPVGRYLDDARAMARTRQLPEDVRAVAVAGLCRGALEAACFDVIRSRKLAAGVPHADVERALESARTLHHVMALAMFGSTTRGGDVIDKLRSMGGTAFVNAFNDCKSGVHERLHGDLKRFVEDVDALAQALRQ